MTPRQELLEREAEIAALQAGLEAARSSRGSLILVRGEAGIGKTALLAATRRRATEAEMEVLAARGGELEQSLPFGAVRQLFEERVARVPAPERDALLSGAAALSAPALGLERMTEPDQMPLAPTADAATAASVQHGLYWLAVNLAERAPLLLAIDDLHWADSASVRWLLYLARRLEGLPILVAVALRPGEPTSGGELLAALEAEPVSETLKPTALSLSASTGLIRDRLHPDAEEEFCEACHRASGGNPFLLSELVTSARDDGIEPSAASATRVHQLGPAAISRSVLLRVARLPAGAEPLLRAMAVLGSEAGLEETARLAGLDEAVASAAADALARAAIFAPGLPLRFAHPVLRAAVYGELPSGQRALAHSRAARVLAEQGAHVERVAGQLLHSEPVGEEWAVEALRRAADDAVRSGVPEAAIAYLRQALVEPSAPRMRPELLRTLLRAATAAGDQSALEGVSDDPVTELTGDSAMLIESARDLAGWLFVIGGRVEDAVEVTERAIAAADNAGRVDRAIEGEVALLSVVQMTPPEASDRLERYAGRAEPGTAEERLLLAQRAWWLHWGKGAAVECVELALGALEGGRIFGERPDTPFGSQAMLVLLRADELDSAERAIDQYLSEARGRGSVLGFTGATCLRARLALRRGDVAAAAEDAREGVELARTHGMAVFVPLFTAWLVEALIERGELAEAEAQLVSGGFEGAIPEHYWVMPILFQRGLLRLAQGRATEGVRDLREFASFLAKGRPHAPTYPAFYPVSSALGLALASLGEREEARRLAEGELTEARRWGTPRAVGVALRALGMVERGERGVELLRQAAEALEASPTRLEQARALTDFGAAVRRAGRRSEAREALRRALEMAHRCGATPVVDRAREELTATGAKPRRIALTGVDSLTPSELRVARMAAHGMENKQIAQALFITVKTVETHLSHVYGKLDISSRKDLPQALGVGNGPLSEGFL